eukprot:scaffold12618_cov23-Tisochrysis_lutea.AAC.2
MREGAEVKDSERVQAGQQRGCWKGSSEQEGRAERVQRQQQRWQTPLDKNAPAIKVQLKNCRLCYAPQAALRQEGASKQRLLRQRRTEARSCIKAMLAQAKPHEGKKLHQSNACSGEAALHCTKAKLWH